MTDTEPAPANSELRSEIKSALNRHSAENASGTADHILADYLLDALAAFDKATCARDKWWGFEAKVGDVSFVAAS